MSAKKMLFSFLPCFIAIIVITFLMGCTLTANNTMETNFSFGKEYTLFSTQTVASIGVHSIDETLDNLYILYESTQTNSQRSTIEELQLHGLYVMESIYGTYTKGADGLNNTLENSDKFLFIDNTVCYQKGSNIGSSNLEGTINWETDYASQGKTVCGMGLVTYNNEQAIGIIFKQNDSAFYLVINPEDGSELFQENFNSLNDDQINFGPFTFQEKTLLLLQNTIIDQDSVLITLNLEEEEDIIYVSQNEKGQLLLITYNQGRLHEIGYTPDGEMIFKNELSENTMSSRNNWLLYLPAILAGSENNAYYATDDNKLHQVTSTPQTTGGETEPEEFQIEYVEHPPEETTGAELLVKFESTQPVTYVRSYMAPEGGELKDSLIPILDSQLLPNGKYQYTIKFTFEELGKNYQVAFFAANSAYNNGYLNLSNELNFEINVIGEGIPPKIKTEEPIPTSTSEASLTVKVLADQILNELRITNNGILNTISDPQGEVVQTPNGNNYCYTAPLELKTGDNNVEIQGENENGTSNTLSETIERINYHVKNYSYKDIIGTDLSESPVDISKNNETGKIATVMGKNSEGEYTVVEINSDETLTDTGLKVANGVTALRSDSMNSEFFEQLQYYVERLTSENAYNGIIPNLQGYESVSGQLKYDSGRIRNLVQKTDDQSEKKIEGHYPGPDNDHALDYQCIDVPDNTKAFQEVNFSGNKYHGQILILDSDGNLIMHPPEEPENLTPRATELLFTIPQDLGEPVDISMHELGASTTHIMITSVTASNEYFVSIFDDDGITLGSFQINQSGITSEHADEELFFKAFLFREGTVVGSEVIWEYGNIYVINNQYPGIQIWEPGE